MNRTCLPLLPLLALATPAFAGPGDGNRLTYLDSNDPYYVSRKFPKLVTPQWVGEDGVEAVVVLAIDDMRGHEKWEKFLRPILNRLKKIDGRAPVSIMTCDIDPKHPHLQKWLKEGLSLETHTIDHPCPLLQRGDFAKAKSTYDRCVDLLARVPGSKPVAFRVPCCDSLNTPSPRFYSEIFNKTTPKGNFLALDSSVFNVFTADDPDLPRDLVLLPDGRERFRRYLPADRTFVNTIEDYPYPYVINKLCWQFPCATPSDWAAQHLHKPNNPITVRDWKAYLDATVRKQGVMNLVFHPHGWIKAEQVVDLIDHAVAKHGKKVKFLTFRECHERLTKNLLGGHPLREPETGQDHGVRLIDLNNDGYLDVVIGYAWGRGSVCKTRVWSPRTRSWTVSEFPVPLAVWNRFGGGSLDAGVRFGILRRDGYPSMLRRLPRDSKGWHFDGARWVEDKTLVNGLVVDGKPVYTAIDKDLGVRLRDLDGDGRCELIVSNPKQQAVFAWSAGKKRWAKLPFTLPPGATLLDDSGRDNGVRFVDVDEDGHDDVVFSNDKAYGIYLFDSMKKGWSRRVLAGKRGDRGALPLFVWKGTDNGAFFHSRHIWWQNEHTAILKDLVDRRSFNELLAGVDLPAKSPAASLRCLKARPGFVVGQVAAEPLVQDPIAFAWGPDGKLWVVEMGDYPLGVDGKGKPGGRVKFLEDTDGDGVYDKATVFLDKLPFPTGVMPWRKGVLITCAPDVLYAEETDGKVKVKKLYTGFVEGNQQHRVNGLAWGLDNWVYLANGDSGGRVKSLKTGKVVDISGRDLRIQPDTGGLDTVTGQTQYGRSRDDWGNWFGGNNSNPLWHFVLADSYLRRNRHVAPPTLRVSVPEVPGAAPVFPRSRTLPRFNDPHAANRFTSACSPVVYRDDLFGPPFAGNVFVSEPVHNLVHREVMMPRGFTFRGRRAADEKHSEFLASTDNWFRPTMIRVGPDGALWVADMYRFVIEHPEWIPKDWQKKLDLRAGHDKGRIYRVYPVGKKPRAIPRLDKLDAPGLVEALESPSGYQRDLAQMMLLWRADKGAVPLLEKKARSGERAAARLHALCTLDGLEALKPSVVLKALADSHPGVRRHAVRLCEGRLAGAPELGKALVKLVADPDAQVRLQLAYTLGEWDDPRAGRALGELLLRDGSDPYLLAAGLSSINRKNLDGVLLAVLTGEPAAARSALIERLLALASAMGDDRATVTLLKAVGKPDGGKYAPWQFDALAGLLDGLGQRGSSLGRLHREGNREVKSAVEGLAGLFRAARKLAEDEDAPTADRVRAARLLGRGLDRRKEDLDLLGGLLVPQSPEALQSAAVSALGKVRDPRVPALLLRGWKGLLPSLRARVLDVLLEREDWLKDLLASLEKKQVLPTEVDAARRQRLLAHRDRAIRARAGKVFAGSVDPDRQKVVDSYAGALKLRGDPGKGRALFTKHCAACHRLGGEGHEVGPDLSALRDKSAEYLLIAVLDPNRAVEARYVSYQADLKDGRTLTGVLTAETGTSITLVSADGKAHTVLRTNLESLTSTGKSAMPEGLEKDLKVRDMADLLAYLRAAVPAVKPKAFAGNKPEVVRPDGDGALHLLATNAEIYGRTLVLEEKYANLGHWTSADDRAVWTVEPPRAGKYDVYLEYACDPGSAGNAFVLEADDRTLTGKVAGTGSWDTYRRVKVGVLALKAGRQRVVMRASGPVKGALIDLKMVRLVPAK
jgi:putative membrane-bound dehydrogenase-like protein